MSNGQKNTDSKVVELIVASPEAGSQEVLQEPESNGLLQIKRILRKQEDGTIDIQMGFTETQIEYLVNIAIMMLLQKGVVKFQDEYVEQEQKDFLSQVNPSELHSA